MEGLCDRQLKLRSYIYEIIAICLHAEPSQDTLRQLLSQKAHLENRLAAWHEPRLRESVMRFLSTIETTDAGNLAIDYARLFLGGASGSICPSESSYREGRLFGESTAQVTRFYSRCGFATHDSFTEPNDHIAVEFYFMSLLARSSLAAWQDRNHGISSVQDHVRFQHVFLKDHLSQWIERWAIDVQKLSASGFFKAVADLAVVIVKTDLDFLRGLIEANRFQQ